MNKIKFSTLNLETKMYTNKLVINGVEIEVKQYLPMSDKIDIIDIAIEKSIDADGFINPIKMQILLDLYIVFQYTNIEFNSEDKENIFELYDILESNGIINGVIGNIPEFEYEEIMTASERASQYLMTFNTSLAGIIKNAKANSTIDYNLIHSISEEVGKDGNLTLLKDIISKYQ